MVRVCLAMSAGLSVLAVVVACSSGSDGNAGDPVSAVVFPSDEEVIGMVYSQTYRTPDDFYVDPRSKTPDSYTIHHVKNTSVMDASELGSDAAPYELCTNDFAEAMAWSETDNSSRVINGNLVDTAENNRYFEFVRTLNGVPDWLGYGRVFKCSFVDRSNVDLRAFEGPAGVLNRQPIRQADLKQLAEYLWMFSYFNNVNNAVVRSAGSVRDSDFEHTLMLARRMPLAAIDGCDLIEVMDWTFSANTNDGSLTMQLTTIFGIHAKQGDGGPQVCGD